MSDYYGGENGALARVIELVEVANDGFENSGLATRLRLVGVELIDYVEDPDDMGTDIDRLKNNDDGFADEAHGQRTKFGADLVALLRNGSTENQAGIANLLTDQNGREHQAFSVTSAQSSNNWHAFTHEIGHNLGCAHDRESASNKGLFDYSHGYHIDALDVMTIMAYQRSGERRIPYFSIGQRLLSRVLFVRRSQRTSMWLRRCSPSLEYQSRLKLTGAASANSSSSPDLSMNGLLSSTNTTGTHLSHILLQRLLFAMNVSNSSNITVYGILTSYMIWRPTRKRLQI